MHTETLSESRLFMYGPMAMNFMRKLMAFGAILGTVWLFMAFILDHDIQRNEWAIVAMCYFGWLMRPKLEEDEGIVEDTHEVEEFVDPFTKDDGLAKSSVDDEPIVTRRNFKD